jgi:hypothetical protein
MINHGVLRTDILARTELNAMRTVGDHVGISTFYNLSQSGLKTNMVSLTNDDILRWSATGPYSKMIDAANNSGLTHAVRSRSFTMLRLIDSFTSISVSTNAISGVVNNLATNSIISTTERDNFFNLLVNNFATPAEALFGPNTTVSQTDVAIDLQS